MPAPAKIALLAYDGFQLLDVTGPVAVFAAANTTLGRPVYDVQIVSAKGGLVASNSGITVGSSAVARLPARAVDTLLVSGGNSAAMRQALGVPVLRRWLMRCTARCKRFGSVCSGTFMLAELGLLNGRRAATHWANCGAFSARFPRVRFDPEALFITDGNIWTSAGVTTGIDMALAMVESDLGKSVANSIAKFLVLYVRRPGYQSQFSELLQVQTSAGTPFADLMDWVQGHLAHRLDVSTLAARAHLSERSFYRKFLEATGQTPASFVKNVRLDTARTLLSSGLPLKTIADRTGFQSTAQLNAAFDRRFGMTPTLFRELHHVAGPN